jgi:hypothetical protein
MNPKSPNIFISIVLFLLSIIGSILGWTVGLAWGIVRICWTHSKNAIRDISTLLYYVAEINDCGINVSSQYLLNDVFIKPDAPKRFGNGNETMSHVFGWAKFAGKHYKAGKTMSHVLNRLDKDHVEKAKDAKQ